MIIALAGWLCAWWAVEYHKEYDRFALQHTYPEEHNGSGHYGGRVGRGAADLGSGDWMDPDILFFRNGKRNKQANAFSSLANSCICLAVLRCWFVIICSGGFLYYDRENAVVGALALTAQPSRFFFLYHNPEFLDPRDAERCLQNVYVYVCVVHCDICVFLLLYVLMNVLFMNLDMYNVLCVL